MTKHTPTHTVDCEARQKVRKSVFCTCGSPEGLTTSLPWRIINKSADPLDIDNRTIWGFDGTRVAITDTSEQIPLAKQVANAAFIVRAVNAHEELRDALVRLTTMVMDIANQRIKTADPMLVLYEEAVKAKQAIAKAEGKL